MLSISDFSRMCCLSPQTLRFYHSEGLLVPAHVSEQTGYRSYTFDQVEQAMAITVLRGTGMPVKLVRQALDEPDTALNLLRQHHGELKRQRQAQDEAINDARELLTAWPQVQARHVPETTVISKPVPGSSLRDAQHDWGALDAAVGAAVQEMVRTVESLGAVVSGTPWRALARETPEQKRQLRTAEGPRWLVKVPLDADGTTLAALPGDIEVQTFEAREELSLFLPGKSSMPKYGTAISRLFAHPLDGAYVDIGGLRQLLHDDGIETAVAIRRLDPAGTAA
ncbi:hypothetical protein ADK86_07620 [Streptomyces sp. NRRL F-5755]|uniref:MerR family transcriptional regulator n=1 Tax=Streptomyces sp. NRRL F-5755 TaxID=1519475 RepID=UPI0006B04B16|nr:MerR family transcriptional regulator [Streptomyces sp. NRRL F-5755]KOU05114.1 hypothetical protein ADK86_07620 [Streptomyces sp. NRRL F-5755]